jgi:hypothetical protein
MLVARCAAALGLLVVLGGGCSSTGDCSGGCATGNATFVLSCGSTDLRGVQLSGPCATRDASPSNYVNSGDTAFVDVTSPSPGVCHVELVFATGFIYSADVQFTLQSDNEPSHCACSSFVAPASQSTFVVNNPGSTCLDAGHDAPTEAASLPACPSGASQSLSCASPGSCMGCRSSAGFECTCVDAGDSGADGGGLHWQCIDTGFPCTPGSP